MLEKNSSSEIAVSAPDHFGMRETRERSFWRVGIPVDKCSLKR